MGRKLVVYMIDGKAYGLRTAEIGNWSGKAIFSPMWNRKKFLFPIKRRIYILLKHLSCEQLCEKQTVGI